MHAAVLTAAAYLLVAVTATALGPSGQTHIAGAGLGKTYVPEDCYAPATERIFVDHAAGVVSASTVNPCALLPLGAVVFEHEFPFARCEFAGASLHCRQGDPDGGWTAVWSGNPLGVPGAASMGYAIWRDREHFAETLAEGVALG